MLCTYAVSVHLFQYLFTSLQKESSNHYNQNEKKKKKKNEKKKKKKQGTVQYSSSMEIQEH